jgi:FkbM family methyltransferase
MNVAMRFFRWIKNHKQTAGLLRGPRRLAVLGWKVARQVPLLNQLQIPASVDGHRLWIRLFSYDDLLTISDDYETCLAGVLPPWGGVAVDAGAFIGRHTLAYARAVGPQGRVVAVEPLPANFRLLSRNVERNGYRQVACVRCALGREEGTAQLSYERETSTASLVRDLPHKISVIQHTLGHVLQELGISRIDLLKLDVEGAEGAVLEGSLPVLAASPHALLVIEVHGRLAPGQSCPLAAWLREHSFSVQPLKDGERLFYFARRAGELQVL